MSENLADAFKVHRTLYEASLPLERGGLNVFTIDIDIQRRIRTSPVEYTLNRPTHHYSL